MRITKIRSLHHMLHLFFFSVANSYGQNSETIMLPCQSFKVGAVYIYKEIIEKKATLFEEVTVVSNDKNIIELRNKSTKLTDLTPTITYLHYKKENNTCYFHGNNIKASKEITLETSFLPALPVCGETPKELDYKIISTQKGSLTSLQNFEMKKTLTLMGYEIITTPAGTFYCTVIMEKIIAEGDSSHVEKSRTLYFTEDVGIVKTITEHQLSTEEENFNNPTGKKDCAYAHFSAKELIQYTP